MIPKLRSALPAAVLAASAALLFPTSLRAADHGDAPALAQDQGADIADVFAFMDPAGDGKSDVILIATFHGFITPGEASNFSVFDPNVKFHFEIYNDHVNLTAPPIPGVGATKVQKAAFSAYQKEIRVSRTIDVTFNKRATDPLAASSKPNLKTAVAQTATVTLGGFDHPLNKGVFKLDKTSTTAVPVPLVSTPPTLQDTAKAQHVNTIAVTPTKDIQFFAGEVDDPFFFDIPGFNALIDSLRDPAVPNNFNFTTRGRDTFGGYNCLAIALKIPKDLLVDATKGTRIGVDFMTQRHSMQQVTNDGVVGKGGYKTVDRMGNPAVNVALIPFDTKNKYNAGTAKGDASGQFAGTILETLAELGVTASTPNATAQAVLANIAVFYGDLLQLDTNIANIQTGVTGGGGDNAATGFGTLAGHTLNANGGGGRRLMDDTINTIISVITNGTVSEPVAYNQDGFAPTNVFPFLHTPHQPLTTAAGAEDGTRN